MQDLNNLIKIKQPTQILAHSLECNLLLNYFDKFKPNQNLQRIFLVQGDFDSLRQIPIMLQNHLEEQTKLEIYNFYCQWDYSLIYSSYINKYKPAGLIGWQNQAVHNQFLPLLNLPHSHQDILKSKRFA